MLAAIARARVLRTGYYYRYRAALYSVSARKEPPPPSPDTKAALPTDLGERLDICASCEHCKLGPNKLPLWCGECKCAIVPKASFEALHCPIGKW